MELTVQRDEVPAWYAAHRWLFIAPQRGDKRSLCPEETAANTTRLFEREGGRGGMRVKEDEMVGIYK